MKISVITICYNEKNVEETCISVVNQTFEDFEWIVIDGGSNNDVLNIFQKYKDRINIFISEKDNGIYNAMNKGIKLSKGDYLLFLNAGDSLFDKNSLIKVSRFLGKEDIIYGNLKTIQNGKSNIQKFPQKIPYYWLAYYALPHPSSFFKKELFDKHGLYNENYKIVSDWEKYIEFIDINKCSYRHIPITVSTFYCNGISSTLNDLQQKERDDVIKKLYGNVEIEPPSKKVIKILGIPLIKIINKLNTTTYYLFGIFPIIKT